MARWHTVAVLALILSAGGAVIFPKLPIAAETPGSAVKIEFASGHCSGTHIGNGLVITAAHCLTNDVLKEIKADTGRVTPASVLWKNAVYDVALLSSPELVAEVATISCRMPLKGEPITGVGSPKDLEFVRIKGEVITGLLTTGHKVIEPFNIWLEMMVAEMSVDNGSSGGPVFDKRGKMIGMMVGKYTTVRFSIIVPAPTICRLLGRA